MGGQKKFMLIPEHPAAPRDVDHSRPMTSKQVKKAYKEANKAPRMSRAEQRKQERREQERIRKEHEAGKAAAKARVNREKKKAKEAAEREEKKRLRLPLVTVQPSQSTISNFVRGLFTSKKKRSAEKEVSNDEIESADEMPPPPKPVITLSDNPSNSDDINDDLSRELKKDAKKMKGRVDETGAEDVATNEPLGQASPAAPSPKPAMEEAREIVVITTDKSLGEESESDAHVNVDDGDVSQDEGMIVAKSNATLPPVPTQWRADLDSFGESFDDDLDFQVHNNESTIIGGNEEVDPAEPQEQTKTAPHTPTKQSEAVSFYSEFDETDADILQALDNLGEMAAQAKTTTHGLVPLAKPISQDLPLSSRAQARYEEEPHPLSSKHSHMNSRERVTPSPLRQAVPLSTQAIFRNLDDFFPSSSQQARELEEEHYTQETPIRLPHHTSYPPPSAQEPQTYSPPPSAQPSSPPQGHQPPPQLSPTLPSQLSSSPAAPPRRFFTSSGSHEVMALAMQRSRRTAALEELQRQERARMEVGAAAEEKARRDRAAAAKKDVAEAPKRDAAKASKKTATKAPPPPQQQRKRKADETAQGAKPTKVLKTAAQVTKVADMAQEGPKNVASESNKENQLLSASQETEYGGEWVEDIDLELIM